MLKDRESVFELYMDDYNWQNLAFSDYGGCHQFRSVIIGNDNMGRQVRLNIKTNEITQQRNFGLQVNYHPNINWNKLPEYTIGEVIPHILAESLLMIYNETPGNIDVIGHSRIVSGWLGPTISMKMAKYLPKKITTLPARTDNITKAFLYLANLNAQKEQKGVILHNKQVAKEKIDSISIKTELDDILDSVNTPKYTWNNEVNKAYANTQTHTYSIAKTNSKDKLGSITLRHRARNDVYEVNATFFKSCFKFDKSIKDNRTEAFNTFKSLVSLYSLQLNTKK